VFLVRELLTLLLPSACAACGRASAAALCERCARALPALAADEPAPPPLAAWAAGAPYEGAWAAWLQRFKYPGAGLAGLDPAAAAVAAELARRAARAAPGAPPALVVPVPLHPARLRTRGFNPAARLAAVVARAVRAPLDATALLRLRDTPSQTGLSRKGRRRNVAGAFRAPRPLPARIWLVDDVATTGSTLAEAARAARCAGAREIIAVCAVRRLR
jgi:ComF family protein